ncbi:MAG: universal stress protein [Bacillota bacterium]|nr:universal stress protein [Bacillota bacterium]
MKMLVCVDGSEQSQKALEKAALIAAGPHINEVTVIHIFEGKMDPSSSAIAWGGEGYAITEADIEHFKERYEMEKKKGEAILQEAKRFLAGKNIEAETILKDGHPSHTIIEAAQENDFDIIVVGSRGLGGFKKLLLGSVSNAIAQEAKNCCVLIVK